MLVEFEDDCPIPSVVTQFVEPVEDFLDRVEDFVENHKGCIKGVKRVIDDEEGTLRAHLAALSLKYEVPLDEV